MMQLFHTLSEECSRLTTEKYSTSFASAIRLLHKDLRQAIHGIYGFVRLADEIVDSFHEHAQAELLEEFESETYLAIERKISLNPILNSFQRVVHNYSLDLLQLRAFFKSMRMDLHHQQYVRDLYEEYIYGSAEVVGLMCLSVFCEGDRRLIQKLEPAARSLGAAFQKVNFLRDLKDDHRNLNRSYFPGFDVAKFTEAKKREIEEEIENDFAEAIAGIYGLPAKARLGVYIAYKYYLSLFYKIKKLKPSCILAERVRIPNYRKLIILMGAGVRSQFNLM